MEKFLALTALNYTRFLHHAARLGNPTQDVLEQRFAKMENGAAALAVSSGTAACFYAVINCCQKGDNIVSAQNLYGGTFTQFHDILPQFGTSYTHATRTSSFSGSWSQSYNAPSFLPPFRFFALVRN
jgi:O-acetylhomoserine/O-acetylserine sulfhydrylase-like pyridoxal-dependent enzyme